MKVASEREREFASIQKGEAEQSRRKGSREKGAKGMRRIYIYRSLMQRTLWKCREADRNGERENRGLDENARESIRREGNEWNGERENRAIET